MTSKPVEAYKHRKGTKKVKVIGRDGKPLQHAKATVKQSSHQFLFGCAEFSMIPYANDELVGEAKEKADEMFGKFFELFNYSTLPFYWSNFEKTRGRTDASRLQRTAEWLKSKGCALKGHPLCWHTLAPSWLLDMNHDQILAELLGRIEREVSHFHGWIDTWDVINEAVIMPIFDKDDNGITRICKDMGRIRMVREVFRAAKQANPDAILLINDFVYTNMDSYEILIEGCLEAEIPIDAIGIQAHMHQGYWGVEKTQEVLERFAPFQLPIHFTENSLVSGHPMPADIVDFNDYVIDSWPTTPEGEERQAREAAKHYETLFAHPLVASITWWDFVDGQWLGAPVGLTTQDHRLKPAYEELYKRIKGEWWTGPVDYVTDDQGYMQVSGFLGSYEIDCQGIKGSFVVDDSKEEQETIVDLRFNKESKEEGVPCNELIPNQ